ncbi:MAG: hypothetical protein JJ974_11640 [Phycisphaerales bacterium]|nr:hypothetical protein [Phycisphaerales bacterium]
MLTTLPENFGETVVILGAGATVGTSLRDSMDRPRPPLDADFFTQIQRLKNMKHVPYVEALLKFCYEEFGPGWSLGMEQFYNYVWYSKKFRTQKNLEFNVGSKLISQDVETVFKNVLLAVFEESLYGMHSQDPLKQSTCALHDAVAQNLQPDDCVISFNYDCVMDCSMVTNSKYWRSRESYGLDLADKNLSYWDGKDTLPKGVAYLYKLHGSINWKLKSGQIELKQRPYTRQQTSSHFHIVPPVISKDFLVDGDVLSELWKSASKKLADAKSVVVVGYSVPDADALANAMLASRAHAAQEGKEFLSTLVIANMDSGTRRKIINTFRSSIGPKTKVLVFDTMDQMNQVLFNGETELS